MLCGGLEVFVCTQQREFVAQAELSNDCVDGSDLNSGPAACVSKFCSGNVIFSGGLDQRQCGKPFDDLRAGFRAGEALKQLLQYKPCRDHDISTKQCFFQVSNFRFRSLGVPTKGQ